MDDKVTDRIKMIINNEGLTVTAFAKKIGFNQSNLSKVLRGERNVPENLIGAILDNTDASRKWLLTGEGEMIASPEQVSNVVEVPVTQAKTHYATTKNGITFYRRQDGKLVMEAPVVPIEALGSPQDEYAAIINEHEGEKALFEVEEVHHGSYLAFKVSGDSMDDGTRHGFEKGDIVLVRELDRDKWMPRLHYNTWPFWVVVFGNCVRIKQIIAQDEHTGAIMLHSLNPSPEYTDFTLQLDEINRLFNVVQHIPHPNKF